MIAKIFSKTSPLNYLFVLLIVAVLYWINLSHSVLWDGTIGTVLYRILLLVLLLGALLLNDFIVHKNGLTKLNNYALLLYALFIILFPTILLNEKVIVANFFILLALRRLIALQSLQSSKEKIFDASFWILIASLFHVWCMLYFVLVFISILSHVSRDYRNWIIPILAFLTVVLLFLMVDIQMGYKYSEYLERQTYFSLDFTYFENIYQHIALAVFASIALFIFITQFADLGKKPLSIQDTYKKILLSFVIAVAIYVFSAYKNNSLLIFTFTPLSIMGTNLLEKVRTNWVREVSFFLLIAISLFFYIMAQ